MKRLSHTAKVFAVSLSLALVDPAHAANTNSAATQSNQVAVQAAVDSLAEDFAIFQTASQQWVSNNLSGDAWNSANSTTPLPFGTYPPVLLYAGQGGAGACGAPAAVQNAYDLDALGYLPSNFSPAYSGEYCSIIYPDSGTTTISGPIGTNGGSNIVSATTVYAYMTSSGTATTNEDILSPSSPAYAMSHIGPLLAQHFSGGGAAESYQPTYNADGTNDGQYIWQEVKP